MVEWQALQQSSEWDAWVGAAFDQFNGDGSGFMGESDLAAMLCKDGQCAMPDIVQSALRCAPSLCATEVWFVLSRALIMLCEDGQCAMPDMSPRSWPSLSRLHQ